MNIAIFASDFYPSVGGVQEVVRQSAHALIKAGDRPMIFTNRWPKSLPASEILEQIPVHRHVFRVPEPNFKQMGGALLVGPWTLRQVCRQLKQHRAELIHIHCVSSNAYYAVRRLVVGLVCRWFSRFTVNSRWIRLGSSNDPPSQEKISAPLSTKPTPSPLAPNKLWPKPKLSTASHLVIAPKSSTAASASTISQMPCRTFTPGRTCWQSAASLRKRIRRSLASLRCKFSKNDTTHDLILAGDGPERAALTKLAEELQISNRVHFFGPAPRETTVRLFAGCTFLVTPSRLEAMGIVNLEAMAAGKAIISSRVGGVPEIVDDGRNGVLVTPESVAELSQAMVALLTDPARREKLAEAGRMRAMEFDWSRINEQFRRIYSSLIPSHAVSEELPEALPRAL